MPPASHQKLPPAAQPQIGNSYDPWNSTSTGHQRSEGRIGIGWRDSRALKMQNQFAGKYGGGERLADTYGPGAEDYDEKLRAQVPKEMQARMKNNVANMLMRPGSMKAAMETAVSTKPGMSVNKDCADGEKLLGRRKVESEQHDEGLKGQGLFDGLVVFVNGSTHPLISDYKLKRLLAEHGARLSIHLARRQVTHVILGRPASGGQGCGGGLAGGKLEKEIRRVGGCGVKYVGVEW